jgi:hypothetical protein
LRAALNDADEWAAQARSIRNAEPATRLESGLLVTGEQPVQQDLAHDDTTSNSIGGLHVNGFTSGNIAGLGFSNDLLLPDNMSLDWNAVFDTLKWI